MKAELRGPGGHSRAPLSPLLSPGIRTSSSPSAQGTDQILIQSRGVTDPPAGPAAIQRDPEGLGGGKPGGVQQGQV